MDCTRAAFLAAATLLLSFLSNDAQAGSRETAEDELYWAFHACEEGVRDGAEPLRRLQLLDDYRFRRARAVRADATVLKTARVREYVVREWLARCDVAFPRQVDAGRKEAAQSEAQAALAQCKSATERGSLDAAEADYRAFKEKSKNALKLDPKLAQKKDLAACDKRVSDWLAKRREVEAEALKRVRGDREKVKNQLTFALH
jgi:hypothetical protein